MMFHHLVWAAVLAFCPTIDSGITPVALYSKLPANTPLEIRLEKARTILHQATLVPGPRSVKWFKEGFGRGRRFNVSLSGPSRSVSATLPGLSQLRKAKVTAQVWSVQVPCGAQYHNAVQLLLEQLDILKRLIVSQSEYTKIVTSSQEVHEARRQGVLGSLIRVEGGHALGSSLGVLRSLPELGVSSLSLTHSCPTPWAESGNPSNEIPNSVGLTKFGKDLVAEMNRLGLVVDLGGASTATAQDALRASRSPVIFSDAFTRAKCPTQSPSSIPDQVIYTLPRNGGVLMIALTSSDNSTQNSCAQNNSIRAAIEHINHVRALAGIDHVGVGSTDNPERYALLVAELTRDKNWNFQSLQKLLGGNFLRVLEEVLQVRDEMADESPSEEIIPIHDIDDRWPCRFKFSNSPTR